MYYYEHYADHVNAQNARNEKTRHIERNRTVDDLLKNNKTCPEESIYQIGTMEESVPPETLALIVSEFYEEFENRFGSHIHILDWALHLDEGTPHIHERHALNKGLDVDPTTLGKDGIKYKNSVDFIKNGASTGAGDYCQQGGPKAAYKISKEMIDNEEYVKDAMWGPQTPTLLDSGSTLDDILTEGFTKIIVGEKDINYFDTLVKDWEKAGGTKATEEINETYGK